FFSFDYFALADGVRRFSHSCVSRWHLGAAKLAVCLLLLFSFSTYHSSLRWQLSSVTVIIATDLACISFSVSLLSGSCGSTSCSSSSSSLRGRISDNWLDTVDPDRD
ncbi:hypothetical protein MUK42_36318, partial [Musa troglodytarum]